MLAVALTVLLPVSAFAHGRLKGSTPSAGSQLTQVPRELRLDFSESPDLTFSTIRLAGPDGREIPLGAIGYATDSHRSLVVPIAGALMAGRYTIVWQMAGDDGHPVRGRIEFTVAAAAPGLGMVPTGVAAVAPVGGATATSADAGKAGMPMHHDPMSMPDGSGGFGAESPLYVVIRWLQFVALLLVIGAVSFHTFVLASIRRDPHSENEAGERELLPVVEARAARIGHVAALGLAVTLLARLAAQAYAMHGAQGAMSPAMMSPMLMRTMWGWGWWLELAGVVLAGMGFRKAGGAPPPTLDGPARAAGRSGWRLAGAGAVLLAFAPGLSSHASAAPRMRLLAMLADGVHVLGASSWLGSLSVMLIAGLSIKVVKRQAGGGAFVRDLINAFSPVALVSAGIAASTGVFAAWLHVGRVPNLWGTRYGITLLIKLGVLGVVALTGFYNWRFVQPKLGTSEATADLRRSALVEVAVAVVVLLVTAVLVASPTSMDMEM